MNEARNAEPEESPYFRVPLPLVTVGLVAVLVAVIGVGLFANRYLRPGVQPGSTPIAVVPTSVSAPTLIPIAAATTQTAADPTPGLAVQATATTAPLQPPTQVLTPAATTAAAPQAILTTTSTPEVVPSQTPSALPTVEPVLAKEVGQAYEEFWRVRSQALLELDSTHLPEVMDAGYLVNMQTRIDELRTEGRAIKTQVTLNYIVVEVTPETASVIDDFEDNSIYVKIDTEDALTSPVKDRLRVLYMLRKYSDSWKVVESVRSE